MFPEQAHIFDTNPAPTVVAAEEGVVANAAAPDAVEPTASVADVAVTPAVDAPVPQAAAASATPAATTEGVTATVQAFGEPSSQPSSAVSAEPVTEPTAAAVAVLAPGTITSSEVVEVVGEDGTVPAGGEAANVPVVWVAQGSMLLLTIVLTSLWWRSRNPRRPRGR
jgi:hypothetical protein